MSYEDLKEIDDKFHADYNQPLGDHETIFSSNNKLRWSIDFPIARTCMGRTPVCSAACYGTKKGRPQARNLDVLEKHLRVLHYFRNVDCDVVAQRIVKGYEAKRLQCLRWCGVGDLTIEAVRVINTIAREHSQVRQWVVSRIPHLLAQVDRSAQNVSLMFSTDGSLESALALEEMARYQHQLVKISYLRVAPDEEIPDVDVVFDAEKGFPAHPPPLFGCPGDSGAFGNKAGACMACHWHCLRGELT